MKTAQAAIQQIDKFICTSTRLVFQFLFVEVEKQKTFLWHLTCHEILVSIFICFSASTNKKKNGFRAGADKLIYLLHCFLYCLQLNKKP